MHTLKVGAAGMSLLALCVLAGRRMGGDRGAAKGAAAFVPLWLVGTGANLYNGVTQAGYTVKDELPIAGGLFAVPAVVAAGLWWRFRAA